MFISGNFDNLGFVTLPSLVVKAGRAGSFVFTESDIFSFLSDNGILYTILCWLDSLLCFFCCSVSSSNCPFFSIFFNAEFD